MHDAEAYLRLHLANNLTPRQAWKNVHAHGNVCVAADLIEDKGVANQVKRMLDDAHQQNIQVYTPADTLYPQLLKEIYDPPLAIYVKGQIPQKDKSIALVGTRRPSVYGRRQGRLFASHLAKAGVVVVSGLARGIDTLSHEASLDNQGETIAIFGCGVDQIYPRENAALAKRIAENGCLISEFPLGTEPKAMNFPQRNRIISAMSQGCLVIEAPKKSGALITADFAMEQGREVFALPANLDQAQGVGSNALIKDGAHCVTDPEDILNAFGWEVSERRLEKAVEKDPLLTLMPENESFDVNDLVRGSGLKPQEVFARITDLEMTGRIEAIPGTGWRKI